MKKCYLVTLSSGKSGFSVKLVFLQFPSYVSLLHRLPNEWRKLLATDRAGVKFVLDELGCPGIFPLYRDDLTGKERYKEAFPLKENYIGSLDVEAIRMF